MNYFLNGIKERRFWLLLIGVPALAALIFWDVTVGLFGQRTIWLTFFGGAIFLFYKAFRNSRHDRDERLKAAGQKEFEARRIEELRRIVSGDPQFQTLCYCCRHYDREKTTCTLKIFNPQARQVNLGTPFRYCLYWEPVESD